VTARFISPMLCEQLTDPERLGNRACFAADAGILQMLDGPREALAKALGTGLDEEANWSLSELQLCDGYVGAIVMESRGASLARR
jgi:hypothetical protein